MSELWQEAKIGRKKKFETPELLEEAIEGYFKWATSTPLNEIDYKGKDAQKVIIPRMRAFTVKGLCLYLGVNEKYFNDFRDSLKDKSDDMSLAFSEVITRAYDVIYEQKFTGAAAGFLNPNIIARDLGLADKRQLDGTLKLGKDLEESFE